MLIRKTKIQLVAFLVISVVAVMYALFRFSDVDKVFGQGGYSVDLRLAESGGIFSGAEVTYRGFNVGRVGELSLTRTGLQAQLAIDPEAPPIPEELHAVVANRSAVGEQYVDLRPVTDKGPYLDNGSVIEQESTTTPIRAGELIADLNNLASSVPTDSLRTVVDESYDAFRGTGDDLQVLMDTTRDFTQQAQQALPQTVQLLEQGNIVLDTQNDLSGSLRSFSADLNRLSATLKSSDADLRKLIGITPKVATQVSEVLAETGPGLSALVANLLTTSNITVTRLDGLEQGLVTYPVLAVGAQTVAPGDGTAHLGLVLNLFDPPPCYKGYRDPETYRPGNVTEPRKPKLDAYCAEPQGSPINVRGSQNAPYNGVPVDPSEGQVAANSNRPGEATEERKRDWQERAPGLAGSSGMSITSLGQLVGLPD